MGVLIRRVGELLHEQTDEQGIFPQPATRKPVNRVVGRGKLVDCDCTNQAVNLLKAYQCGSIVD